MILVTLASNINYFLHGVGDTISYLHCVLSDSSLFKGPLDVGHTSTGLVPPSPSTVAQYSLFQSGWNVPLTSAALSLPGACNVLPYPCIFFPGLDRVFILRRSPRRTKLQSYFRLLISLVCDTRQNHGPQIIQCPR